MIPDGNIIIPDGNTTIPAGIIMFPDGNTTIPGGNIVKPPALHFKNPREQMKISLKTVYDRRLFYLLASNGHKPPINDKPLFLMTSYIV